MQASRDGLQLLDRPSRDTFVTEKRPLVYYDEQEGVIVYRVRDDPENVDWLQKLRKMKAEQKAKEEADSGDVDTLTADLHAGGCPYGHFLVIRDGARTWTVSNLDGGG